MKITYHFPTEQYGFLEAEITTQNDSITALPELLKGYGAIVETARRDNPAGPGIPELEFNKILDKYMATQTMTSSEYESLDSRQQNIIQCLKRAYKRQNGKT